MQLPQCQPGGLYAREDGGGSRRAEGAFCVDDDIDINAPLPTNGFYLFSDIEFSVSPRKVECACGAAATAAIFAGV